MSLIENKIDGIPFFVPDMRQNNIIFFARLNSRLDQLSFWKKGYF